MKVTFVVSVLFAGVVVAVDNHEIHREATKVVAEENVDGPKAKVHPPSASENDQPLLLSIGDDGPLSEVIDTNFSVLTSDLSIRNLNDMNCTSDSDCDDNNACTTDICDQSGICRNNLKICRDNDPRTADVCLSTTGCAYYSELPETFGDAVTAYMYEEKITLTMNQVNRVVEWLRSAVSHTMIPFCWKQSYGRGVGVPLSTCPSNRDKIGLLCYSRCPAGFIRFGFDCHQTCPQGWRDDGLFCRLAEYGRGVGFAWSFWDGFSNRGMFQRCERVHGRGNCEQCLAIVYPKCRAGFHPVGCNICRPNRPDCNRLGYNGGLDLSCAKRIVIGDPTPMICSSGLQEDAGLCYPFCRTGFYGVGPVCWQRCAITDCGAACANSGNSCTTGTLDLVFAPLIVAANMATMGMTSVAANAANAVRVGTKYYQASTKVGRLLLRAANVMTAAGAAHSSINRVDVLNNSVEHIENVQLLFTSAMWNYENAFAMDFATMTSADIDRTLNSRLSSLNSHLMKRLWAIIQFQEMAIENQWNGITSTLALVSVLPDPTGLTGLAAAYVKPICASVVPFPTL